MPCSLPRRTGQVRFGFFPARAAFPGYPAGRRPRLCFRGLLKLHSLDHNRRTMQTLSQDKVACSSSLLVRPANSQPAQGGLLSRGSDPASYPTKPLGSYHAYRQLHGWILPPLEIFALGARGYPVTGLPFTHRAPLPEIVHASPDDAMFFEAPDALLDAELRTRSRCGICFFRSFLAIAPRARRSRIPGPLASLVLRNKQAAVALALANAEDDILRASGESIA